MFNRSLQVKMVKTAKDDPAKEDSSKRVDDLAAVISKHVNNTFKRIGIGVVTYVVLDTARQVIVAKAHK